MLLRGATRIAVGWLAMMAVLTLSAIDTSDAIGAPLATPRPYQALLNGDRAYDVPPPAIATPRPRVVAPKPAVRKRAVKPRRVVKVHRQPKRYVAGPTSWSDLNAAINRIHTYRAGVVKWVVADTGYWATANWRTGVIYISRSTPTRRLYDVAVHEWSHILSVRAYGGDVDAAKAAMKDYYGGSDQIEGAEYAADCMALLQGARWTHYTSCTDSRWRAGARRLIAGQRLP